jgi:hypothetical protein
MKSVFLMAIMMLSMSAFAAWNEVECTGQTAGKTFSVDVEQPFPNGSYFKRAQLTVVENGAEQTYDFTVNTRVTPGFSRVTYMSSDIRLEVDFWPDQRPRWGWTYRGTVQSSALGNQYIQGLNCRFPNAF